MSALWTGWTLALTLGVLHAFEPDHLAAVATLISTRRHDERATHLGALWGLGHAAMLLLVGSVLVTLRLTMPGPLASAFEGAVALLLLLLGVRSLVTAARAHHHHHTQRRMPLLVGVAHGLAGSGALTTLALAAMPSLSSALVYLVLFSLGSVAAMALAAGLFGWPLGRLARDLRLKSAMAGAAGVFSFALGVRMLLQL